MDAQAYPYSNLHPDASEIRLAHILPGNRDDPIHCELHVASLDNGPLYQTLSYVWGDPTVTRSIRLDGIPHPVTTNLYAALRRLRQTSGVRVMWIDALCINQYDPDERTHQVGLMGRVYARCNEVVLWIGDQEDADSNGLWTNIETAPVRPWHEYRRYGPANPYSPDSNDMLTTFVIVYLMSSDNHVSDLPYFMELSDRRRVISPEFANGLKSLEKLFSLAYWTRAWVLQEMILPKYATVVYGALSAPWQMFVDASNTWVKHRNTCCLVVTRGLTDECFYPFEELARAVQAVEYVRHKRRRIRGEGGIDLLQLLVRYFTRASTDPRDKVYALLGLVTDWYHADPIVPDCSISTLQAFESVTLHIISTSNSLRVLTGDHYRSLAFPSWVCDWSNPFQESELAWVWETVRLDMWDSYNASSGMTHKVEPVAGSRLSVSGFHVDTITGIGDVIRSADYTQKNALDAIPSCEQLLELTGLPQEPRITLYKRRQTWSDAYWRTLCADIAHVRSGYRSKRTVPEDNRNFELWKAKIIDNRPLQLSKSDEEDLQGYFNAVLSATSNRRLFVTSDGYLGIGPKDTQIGDEVYVIIGSNVPFVLRADAPQFRDKENCTGEDTTKPTYPHFRLIGDCYTHGIMDGEACNAQASYIILC